MLSQIHPYVIFIVDRNIMFNCLELCISAHTKESAKALADTIKITYPEARLVFVVAMASDKDHQA